MQENINLWNNREVHEKLTQYIFIYNDPSIGFKKKNILVLLQGGSTFIKNLQMKSCQPFNRQ